MAGLDEVASAHPWSSRAGRAALHRRAGARLPARRPLLDRRGRKPLAAAGLALGVVGSVVRARGAASSVALSLGRLVGGASVAVAMVVDTSWIKELSGAPFGSAPATGARRALLALAASFGIGAGPRCL